jgi:hypothetical protein
MYTKLSRVIDRMDSADRLTIAGSFRRYLRWYLLSLETKKGLHGFRRPR